MKLLSSKTNKAFCCSVCEAFDHYIDKCTDELKKIEGGVSQAHQLTDVFGEGLIQERLEFVACLRNRIKFIMENPQKECVV